MSASTRLPTMKSLSKAGESKTRRILKTSNKDLPRRDIFLVAPNVKQQRAKFSILERTHNPDGKSKTKTLKLEELDIINERFKVGSLSLLEAKDLVRDIIDQLRQQDKKAVTFNSSNYKILDEFWEIECSYRDQVDPDSSYHRFRRAIEAVGTYSIQTASRDELQREIDSKFNGNAQRRIVTSLNSILKYLRRDFKLRKAKEEIAAPKYLTLKEFKAILQFLPSDEVRLVCKAAFATGCRIGEIFAVEPEHIQGRALQVLSQIDRSGIRRATKNRITRSTIIYEEFIEDVNQWASIPLSDRLKIRNLSWAKIVKNACKNAFPGNTKKHCAFHDLRHSYAIRLKNFGAEDTTTGNFLGNTVGVIQKYYSGRTANVEQVQYWINKTAEPKPQ